MLLCWPDVFTTPARPCLRGSWCFVLSGRLSLPTHPFTKCCCHPLNCLFHSLMVEKWKIGKGQALRYPPKDPTSRLLFYCAVPSVRTLCSQLYPPFDARNVHRAVIFCTSPHPILWLRFLVTRCLSVPTVALRRMTPLLGGADAVVPCVWRCWGGVWEVVRRDDDRSCHLG